MHDRDDPQIPDQQIPRPADRLAQFPGPVAVIHGDTPVWPVASLGGDAVNDEPWALEATYHESGRPCLVVRTVRSAQGMNPRGLPVETVDIQLLNFLSRANRPQGHGLTAPSQESSRITFEQIRAAVDQAQVQQVEVPIDGTTVRGTRTDALDAAVVELAWHGQTVYITGQPGALPALALRTATQADVDHL